MKIDTTNNDYCFVGNSIESDHDGRGWGDAAMGIDGCIYWPPAVACRILKYDPHTNNTTLVGNDFGFFFKWDGGSLASDGVTYCIPDHANRILSIDPWKEYTIFSLENIMIELPEQLGCIFNPSDDMPTETNFDRAVIKFGYKKVMGIGSLHASCRSSSVHHIQSLSFHDCSIPR